MPGPPLVTPPDADGRDTFVDLSPSEYRLVVLTLLLLSWGTFAFGAVYPWAHRPLSIGAVIVGASTFFVLQQRQIAELALKYQMPSVFGNRVNVEAGGLMSYAQNIADSFRRSATYVDKILKGAKPGDLPVEQPVTLELVVNLKTAKALGLTIPQSLLLRADEVIQ